MKNVVMAVLIGVACVCGNSHAASEPLSMGRDTRIKSVSYNPSDVFIVNIATKSVAQIIFEDGETITDTYAWFSAGYEFIPKGNKLTITAKSYDEVRPNSEEWNTNLLVTTDKRNYSIDLRLTQRTDPMASYMVQFTYDDEQREYRKVEHAQRVDSQNAKAEKARERAQVLLDMNYEWIPGKGSDSIIPEMVYSDEKWTYFQFKRNTDLPLITVLDDEDNRSLAEIHKSTESISTLVVRQLSDAFLLTMGSKLVKIIRVK